MRAFVVTIVSTLGIVAAAWADTPATLRRPTHIDAQPLDSALQALANAREVSMVYRAEVVSKIRAIGIDGDLTLDEVLTQLLHGTGLTYRYLDDKTITIAPASTSAVEKESAPSAGDLGSTLAEVIVTATKRPEKLQDVPVAVSAIGREDIQVRGLTQYADYLSSVPGVYFQESGPGQSQVRMRGVVTDEGSGSATVATYFGETVTSMSSGGKPNLRLVDIDRVEVLRGPQGTLFGANSLAGVVRVVPVAPDLQDIEVNVGTRGFVTAHSSDASYHVEGVVNLPLLQDQLALRLVGYKDDIAGYIDNVVPARPSVDYSFLADALLDQPPGTTPAGTLVLPGNPAFTRKDINSESTWGARAALTWQATHQLRFDLTYATQDVRLDSEPQVEPGAGAYAQQREMDWFSPAKYSEGVDVGTFVVNYDWDSVALTSASSYTRFTNVSREDASFSVEVGFGVPIPWDNHASDTAELFTQEVRLQSRGDGPLHWLVGAFYLDQHVDSVQNVDDLSCPTCLPTVFHGQDFAFRLAPGANPGLLDQEQRSIFGEVSYDLTPRWTLGVGGRYLEDELERLTAATEGFLVGGFADAQPPAGGTSREINPSAYLRFKLSADMTLYAQAARGFRSGKANQLLALSGACAQEAASIGLGALTDPDTLWNYELGTKARFAEGRLGVNAAVYQQHWRGVQLPTNLECGFGATVNGGDVEGRGVELEITARLTRAWLLNFSAAYNHNEFDAVAPGVGFEAGERVPGAPQKNASAGVQYDFVLSGDWSGFARADYAYVGAIHHKFGQADARVVHQGSSSTANARVGVQRDSLLIELFGRNVADERAVVNTADPELGGYQYLGRPREIGVEVRYSFR